MLSPLLNQLQEERYISEERHISEAVSCTIRDHQMVLGSCVSFWMNTISPLLAWSTTVGDLSAVPFVKPDGKGCLNVATATKLDFSVR